MNTSKPFKEDDKWNILDLRDDARLFINSENGRWVVTSGCALPKHIINDLTRSLLTIPNTRPFSYLNVEVTNRCNMSCSYCYKNSKSDGQDMSKGILEASIHHLLRSSSPVKYIGFTGGEPLMNKQLIFETVKRYSSRGINFVMQTNGSLITREFAGQMKQHSVGISVSLDGNEQIHNRNRQFWKKTMEGISTLIDVGYDSISVGTTITKDTCDDIEDIVDFFVNSNIHSFSLSPIINQGRGTSNNGLTIKQWIDTNVRMIKRILYWFRRDVYIQEKNLQTTIRYIITNARDYMCCYHPCGAGNLMLAVDVLGNIYPCDHLLDDSGMVMGHVSNNNLNWSKIPRLLSSMDPLCSQCPFFLFCYGGCPHYRKKTILWGGSDCAQKVILSWIFLRLHDDNEFVTYARRNALG